MNSVYNNLRILFLSACLILLFTIASYAQEVPIPRNHLVNQFIERQITLGNISQSEASVRPISYTRVRNILNKLLKNHDDLSVKDIQLAQRFRSDFSIDNFDSNITFPLSKSNLKNFKSTAFGKYQLQDKALHFLSYRDSSIYAWTDLGETIGVESFDKSVYPRYTDRISILGSVEDKLSFYVNFTMNRFVGDSSLVYKIETFKNEDHPYFDSVNWTLWYQSEAVFFVKTKYGNFQIGKTPVIWGFSPEYSPILSGNTQTFPYVNYSYKYKKFGFHFLHGSLLPNESIAIHENNNTPQKYIAAHRIELELSKNILMSFNEMVIYGNRPFEIEYLLPTNFYWPAEHNQGDRDNLLMALDFSWRIRSGIRWYNTLFWDELAWEKVLTKWWANKFVFQSGFHWVSIDNKFLPDIRFEASISRPWTYTHNELVNSYTSAGIGLGLPQGPNSQSYLLKVGLWPSYRWYLNLSSMYMKTGTGIGSSPMDNYDLRDRDLDENTPYLLGDIKNITEIRLETNYTINRFVNLFGYISYKDPDSDLSGNFGLSFDW